MCCRDRPALLAEALDAVVSSLRAGDELVVVDSASSSAEVGKVATAHGAQVVRCDVPGLARARNAGWRAARGSAVLFTDDDCRPTPGWVSAACAALAPPDVGIVCGQVRAAGGARLELSALSVDRAHDLDAAGTMSGAAHGANMAFRRRVLEDIGGFDPALGVGSRFPAGEDIDAWWRALRHGWRVVVDPSVVVTHLQWREGGAVLRQMFRYGAGAGAAAVKRRRLAGEQVIAEEIWRLGLRQALRAGRRRELLPATGALARAVGVVAGAARAARTPLAGEMLASS